MPSSMEEAFRKAGFVPREQPTRAQSGSAQPQARSPEKPVNTAAQAEILDDDYVNQAEQVICDLQKQGTIRYFTTTKIRSILSLVSDVYNIVVLSNAETLSEQMQDKLRSLRVRLVYECGRERAVKEFVIRAKLLSYLRGIGSDRKRFMRFAQYMEALVAYHRFYGGE